jgi:hypothetical protein
MHGNRADVPDKADAALPGRAPGSAAEPPRKFGVGINAAGNRVMRAKARIRGKREVELTARDVSSGSRVPLSSSQRIHIRLHALRVFV